MPLLGVGLGLAATAQAQTQLYNFNGTAQYDRLGASVSAAGDVNNDGFPDILVGAPEDFQVFFQGEGFVRVYSGANGSILHTIHGGAQYDQFGAAVAGVGDVNSDSRSDFVVGAPGYSTMTTSNLGKLRLVSGQTGATILERTGTSTNWQLGFSVAALGDVNGDGVPDFVAGAPGASPAGSNSGLARVYSGSNGSTLYDFNGSASNRRRGYSVSGIGDINGDGRADIVVGSLFDGVRVYSGLNGTTLHTFTGALSTDTLGKSVRGLGDLNGDGVPDLAIGATQEDVFSPGKGYVQVRSGLTGSLLWTVQGDAIGDRFGSALGAAGDFNADGTPDVVVSAVPGDPSVKSYVRILSGVNGSVLATLLGTADDDLFGFSVAGLGDVNGNGKPDIAVGAPNGDPLGLSSGYARVFEGQSGGCGGTANYCQTAPNSVGSGSLITSSGSTSIGANLFFLLASGAPANQFGIFYYGPNQIQQPFGNGFRCVGGGVFRLPVIQTSSQGNALYQVSFPSLPPAGQILPFSVWNFQFWYRDPAAGGANFNFSNGLNVNFCP